MNNKRYDEDNEKIIEDLFEELDAESMLEADASCGSSVCVCICFSSIPMSK